MNIRIIRLAPEFVDEYRRIRLESLKNHPEAFETRYEDALNQKSFFFSKPISESDATKFVMGAFDEDKLIGICGFVDNNRYDIYETGSIVQMYVDSTYSGKKIGMHLLKKTDEEAMKVNGISTVMLEVNKKNKRAIKVYRDCGYSEFEVEATINEDVLCMKNNDRT